MDLGRIMKVAKFVFIILCFFYSYLCFPCSSPKCLHVIIFCTRQCTSVLARVCRLVTGSPDYACKQFCLTNTVVFKFLNWNALDGHTRLVQCRPHLISDSFYSRMLPAWPLWFLSILFLPQLESLFVLFFKYPIFC